MKIGKMNKNGIDKWTLVGKTQFAIGQKMVEKQVENSSAPVKIMSNAAE